MKRIFVCMTAGLASAFFCGCGSLNQQVGGPTLSKPAMEFAGKMPSGGSTMNMTYDVNQLSTSKYATKSYPFFPVFYWSTLGNFEAEKQYGVSTSTLFFPVFYINRESIYNDLGKRQQSDTMFNLALAIGYEDHTTPKSSDFRTGILWIPGIGPLLGVGPEFFQFLWIPFTDLK